MVEFDDEETLPRSAAGGHGRLTATPTVPIACPSPAASHDGGSNGWLLVIGGGAVILGLVFAPEVTVPVLIEEPPTVITTQSAWVLAA